MDQSLMLPPITISGGGFFLIKMPQVHEAIALYRQVKDGMSISSAITPLLAAYVAGELEDAIELSNALPKKGLQHDALSFGAIIAGLCKPTK